MAEQAQKPAQKLEQITLERYAALVKQRVDFLDEAVMAEKLRRWKEFILRGGGFVGYIGSHISYRSDVHRMFVGPRDDELREIVTSYGVLGKADDEVFVAFDHSPNPPILAVQANVIAEGTKRSGDNMMGCQTVDIYLPEGVEYAPERTYSGYTFNVHKEGERKIQLVFDLNILVYQPNGAAVVILNDNPALTRMLLFGDEAIHRVSNVLYGVTGIVQKVKERYQAEAPARDG